MSILYQNHRRGFRLNYRVWLVPGVAFCLFLYSMVFVLLYTVKLSNTRTGLQDTQTTVNAKSENQTGQQRIGDISKAMKDRLK